MSTAETFAGEACLAELRAELRRSAPTIRMARLRRIRDAHGLAEFPPGFLLEESSASLARRAARAARRLRRGGEGGGPRHPLFDAAFYRLANPDVAGAPSAWVHYQLHGRAEGRSPHPLIDPARLARALPDALPGEVLDRYLAEPRHWAASPGPYLDVEAFVHRGPWDGATNPALQILRDYPVDPWVRSRLGIIDLASADDAVRVAVGALAARRPAMADLASVSVWRGPAAVAAGPAAYRVVPGFFAGADGSVVVLAGREVLAGDGTAVKTPGAVVAFDVRARRSCHRLVFVAGDLARDELEGLASGLGADDLVAPASGAQEAEFARLGARTLPVGRQVTVEAQRLEVVGGAG